MRIKTGNSEWEIYLKDSDMWYSLKETYVKWIDGSNVRIETVSDITKQKRYESELFKVATTDMMTQTINRDTCEKVLNALLSKRNEQINSIVFIDFDGLKFVNDNYGHQEGDFLIMKTINIIKSCIRKSDTISRWGGDEFILILRANQSASNVVMDNINKEITKFNSDKLKPYSLSFSHGIVEINHNTNETIESLMNKLDKKMYENKLIKRG